MDALLARARCYGHLGQRKTAIFDFNAILKVDPGNVQALSGRGFIRLALNQKEVVHGWLLLVLLVVVVQQDIEPSSGHLVSEPALREDSEHYHRYSQLLGWEGSRGHMTPGSILPRAAVPPSSCLPSLAHSLDYAERGSGGGQNPPPEPSLEAMAEVVGQARNNGDDVNMQQIQFKTFIGLHQHAPTIASGAGAAVQLACPQWHGSQLRHWTEPRLFTLCKGELGSIRSLEQPRWKRPQMYPVEHPTSNSGRWEAQKTRAVPQKPESPLNPIGRSWRRVVLGWTDGFPNHWNSSLIQFWVLPHVRFSSRGWTAPCQGCIEPGVGLDDL